MTIPIVDLFAGPGGLGEGFSSFKDHRSSSDRFRIALSIEKDPTAHSTLTLRAFRRQFEGVPVCYGRIQNGELTVSEALDLHPMQARAARREAVQLELSAETADEVSARIRTVIGKSDRWVLIGGPPCQAYSLVGRSRNRGNASYEADTDPRQRLYIEYLQVLAAHAPPIFVMENVKGLLSAVLDGETVFDKIVADLADPARSDSLIGRRRASSKPRYRIIPFTKSVSDAVRDPRDFIIRAEEYGVPQARHRVILLGIREDIAHDGLQLLRKRRAASVGEKIDGLPRVRSGLTPASIDSPSEWTRALKNALGSGWFKELEPALKQTIRSAVERAGETELSRGAEILRVSSRRFVTHHSTRGHIPEDLQRYLFAASFADTYGHSPVLSEFPLALLPHHASVGQALSGGHFADRFRVQMQDRPATTITSHISKDGHYFIHYDPSQCRSLTVREAAILQTFPEDYIFCGPRTEQYHQVGNAVPPMLAQQLAAVVHSVIG